MSFSVIEYFEDLQYESIFNLVGAESGPHITLLLGFLRNSAHLALGLPVLSARMMHVLT